MYTHTHTHICIHTHTHICIHTHTHSEIIPYVETAKLDLLQIRDDISRSQWSRGLRRKSAAAVEIVGSNPTGSMYVCLLGVLCVVR